MPSGYWCSKECPKITGNNIELPGICTKADEKVYCEPEKIDIKEDIGLTSAKDCTNGISFGSVCMRCEYDSNAPNYKCKVNDFNLPQEVPDVFIKSFLDPRYIAYFGKFPEGEDKYWMIDTYEVSLLWIGFSGVMNAGGEFLQLSKFIFKGAPVARQVAKDLVEEGIEKTVAEKLVRAFFKDVFVESAESMEKVTTKHLLRKQLFSFGLDANEELAEKIIKEAVERPNTFTIDSILTLLKEDAG
jgi:hypothetical protein